VATIFVVPQYLGRVQGLRPTDIGLAIPSHLPAAWPRLA